MVLRFLETYIFARYFATVMIKLPSTLTADWNFYGFLLYTTLARLGALIDVLLDIIDPVETY